MRELEILENEDPFYSPFESMELIKAEEEGGRWNVYLEASNEEIDSDGEVTVMKALKDASDYYLAHGVISWDHQHKIMKNPAFIIGEPTDVAFTKKNSTLIKGFLYKENKNAQGVWENLLSKSSRFGASIGGYILKKSVENSTKYIKKVFWDETAITNKPVNATTQGNCRILPYEAFAKALMAGSGINAESFGGGRALTGESLQGSTVNLLPNGIVSLKDIKGWKAMEVDPALLNLIMKGFLKKVASGGVRTEDDVKWFINSYCLKDAITDQITDFLIDKIVKKVEAK
jgi:hypothetical protein